MKRNRIISISAALLLAMALLTVQALAANDWICPQCGKRVREIAGDICPYCGYERHVHEWAPATCVSPQTCKGCGETEGVPDPANHTGETEIRNQREAACEEAGYTGDTCCAACGQVLAQGRAIPAAGHRWEPGAVLQESSCAVPGRQAFTCAVCGKTEERELPVDPSMHVGAPDLRDSRPATCGAAGYTGDTYCQDCGKRVIRGREIPATGRHDWQAVTCTAPKTCRVCGLTEGGPAGHQWGEGKVIYPATCKVEGMTRYTCAACGETRTEILPADPDAHCWDDGSVLYPATCTVDGMARYTCTACGATDVRILPMDPENHAGGQETRNAVDATCEAAGYTGDTYCSACGVKLADGKIVPAAGHDWQAATTKAPKTCRVCGKTEGKPLPPVAAGDIVTFGRYEQDNNKANGPEAIEWQVLEVDEAQGKVLLISKYGLDEKPYNQENTSVTWATCTLQGWLNKDFMKTAFTKTEQSSILETDVDNSRSQGYSEWSTSGGDNTENKIFLLSYGEANRYFNVTWENNSNKSSRVSPTAYAKAQGAYRNDSYMTTDGEAAGWWWLRSPGFNQNSAAFVHSGGSLRNNYVSNATVCVRPALWVNLESGIF